MNRPGARRSVRVRISGRVQAVWFRSWTADEALSLGLDGWVRNRRDGTVEAVFSGPADAVERMIAICHQGPTAARVAAVRVTPTPDDPAPGFLTLATE